MTTETWTEAAADLGLSPRHRAIVDALMRGLSVAGVSYELGIQPETVRTHIKRIYRRLDVHSRMELATVLFAHAERERRS